MSISNTSSIHVLDIGHRVVSRHQRTCLTYHDLDKKSENLARGLLQRGVKKGDRVAVSLGNNVEYAVVRGLETGSGTMGLIECKATYGLFKIGGILVSSNPLLGLKSSLKCHVCKAHWL